MIIMSENLIQPVVLDTNVLLENPRIVEEIQGRVIICSSVLEELDGLKKDLLIGYKAREAIRVLNRNTEYITFLIQDKFDNIPDGWDADKRDNKIIMSAFNEKASLCSNDINVKIKANSLGIDCVEIEDPRCSSDYYGFTKVVMCDEELAAWYADSDKTNDWGLEVNEYLLIKDEEDKIVDSWVWTDKGFKRVVHKRVDSVAFGKLKLLDEYQVCIMDSLFNNPITMVKGRAGSGKSMLSVSYALNMIEKHKMDKLIIFTNPMATKNSARLGFYPGSKDEKLLDSQVGHMLISKFGDKTEVEKFISDGKLLLLPFSDIRGFDTTGMKAIVWISEAQNLDVELMRLAIQRIGDDCQLIIDGDYEAQVDASCFEGSNNGMKRVSEVFRGQDFYGEVELQNVYRSKWADWANKL